MTAKHENVKWVDGLRGIASLLVVFTHIARAFDGDLFLPSSGAGLRPRPLQLPILRIIVQGRIGVTIFSLVTGYVCALKPIRQCRAGNQPACFTSISRSAFRRVPRLVLPTTIATVIIWFLCQFGIYKIAKRCDSWWVEATSPDITPYFGDAVKSLLYHLITTWTRGWNIYDGNQWTLLPLLKGAMLVYIFMLGTAGMKPRYRMMSTAFGMQFFFGTFLSDLSQHPPHTQWLTTVTWPRYYLAPALILLGLIFASYPEGKPELQAWSQSLYNLSFWIFPNDPDIPRYYSGLGLDLIALGIHFSPSCKDFLSHRYLLWFGKNSFAVYLIHGTLLRTLLIWMLYGVSMPTETVNEEGEMVKGVLRMGGRVRWYTMMLIWFVILYGLANAWTKWVDPWCGRVTQRWERYVFEEDGEVGGGGTNGNGNGSRRGSQNGGTEKGLLG
ncbi:hypothetical protein SBOR_10109 [Sclerotinia borealis F-4128]|uniref:Acyltransferase 3 domain-containing protein n=1 Tax=Sclerotinia borealis (strain F-4128) TaxID=1432307 RepID=W9C0R5_SCLBF|nr:hypothetical protein SBOR_10109 [Sclerotinia borealis F-4128]